LVPPDLLERHISEQNFLLAAVCDRDLLHAGYMLGLLFYPEDGGSTILQNPGELLPEYLALHLWR
jgi:hypothetical protein